MSLDHATLSVVTVFVTGLVGLLLLFSWWQNRNVAALAWWGAGFVVAAIACVVLVSRTVLPVWISICIGNALLYVSFGLFWSGCRIFEHRPVPKTVLFAGGFLWLAACGIPEIYRSLGNRVLLASLITSGYTLASAWEIWGGRSERLMSRYPLAGVLVAHALLVLSRYPTMAYLGHPGERLVYSSTWIITHSFEGLLFAITCAFLILAMTKERVEEEQRSIAARDSLTGTRNRRAFLAEGRDLLDKSRRRGQPCALLLLDLDHFKQVNDRYGHAVGDHVLRSFCNIAAGSLPDNALFARIGGEEFGCVLSGTDEAGASQAAEAIRAAFAASRFEADGGVFGATVSIGIATSEDVGHILDALLAAADVSLYGAKNAGRNRVVRLGDELIPPDATGTEPLSIAA